jgi:AcrR family transcriptional regulator
MCAEKLKRGRPRKTDPDVALDAAMNIFWKQGYEGTSMNDLVAVTGMAKPGLYATFGDKEVIYTKALSRYFHGFSTPLFDDLVGSPDPIDVVVRRFLQTVAASALDKVSPNGCFLVNSVIECENHSPALEAQVRIYNETRRTAFVKRFHAAQEQGELPANANALALAEFYSGQVMALAVLGSSGADQKSLERFIEVAMSVLDLE